MAEGENGALLTSTNGVLWHKESTGTTAWLNSADSLEDTWLVVANQGTVLASTNATAWQSVGTLKKKWLYGVAIHEGQLITVGSEGVILRSQLVPSLVPIQIADFDRASGMNAFPFAGAPDQQFWLQSSTNLVTWFDDALLAFLDGSGTLIFVDETGTNAPPTEYFRTLRVRFPRQWPCQPGGCRVSRTSQATRSSIPGRIPARRRLC